MHSSDNDDDVDVTWTGREGNRQHTTHTTDAALEHNNACAGEDGCLTGWMAIEKTIPIALLSLPLPLLLVTVGR